MLSFADDTCGQKLFIDALGVLEVWDILLATPTVAGIGGVW